MEELEQQLRHINFGLHFALPTGYAEVKVAQKLWQ